MSSKEVKKHECLYCDSTYKLMYDLNNTSGYPKFCPFCENENAIVDVQSRFVVCKTTMAKKYKMKQSSLQTISPGIRCFGESMDDHKEPTQINAYVDFYVIGRPITQSTNPFQSFQKYRQIIKGGQPPFFMLIFLITI